MNFKHEYALVKAKLKDFKKAVKMGEHDEQIAIGLLIALTYIVVAVTITMMKG